MISDQIDETLEKSGVKVMGMTEKIKDELTKKWEKGEPIYVKMNPEYPWITTPQRDKSLTLKL